MVHPATCVVPLSLVALWGLVPTPHLLTLHWSTLGVSLGVVVGKVTSLSTLKASVAHRGVGRTRSHWSSCRSGLAKLLVIGAWGLRSGLLELLNGVLKRLNVTLELILPKITTRASRT